MTTKRRSQVIEELRAEGQVAYLAGECLESNPHVGSSDFHHWADGWQAENTARINAEHRAAARGTEDEGALRRLMVGTAFHEYVSDPTEFAHKRLNEMLKQWEDHIVNRTKEEMNHVN